MIDNTHLLRAHEHAEHERLMAEFRARGEEIEYLPLGQCNWDALSDRQKINPQMKPEDVVARRSQARAVPTPPVEQPSRKSRPLREPVKFRRRSELGTALAEALDALVDRDTTASLAARLCKQQAATWQLLTRLEAKGKVRRGSWQGKTTWHRA